MNNLDTKQLRSFLCLAAQQSFSKAARHVGCSQATMSLHIQKLEHELGIRLFNRGPRQVSLTAAGRDLLPEVKALIDMQDRMYERVRSTRVIGGVKLGVAEGYEASLLPGLLEHMLRNHATAELDILCRPSWRLQQMIEARTLDLAVITLPEEAPAARILSRPQLHWVASAEFETDPLIPVPVAWYRDSCFFKSAGIAALKSRGIAYREVLNSPDSRVIRAIVEAGVAITVMAEGTLPNTLNVMSAPSVLPPLGRSRVQLLERPGLQSEAAAVVKRHISRAYGATDRPAT